MSTTAEDINNILEQISQLPQQAQCILAKRIAQSKTKKIEAHPFYGMSAKDNKTTVNEIMNELRAPRY